MIPVSSDSDCVMASHVVERFSRLAVISLFSCGNKYSIRVNNSNMVCLKIFGPQHDKTNKMTCAPSEDSDQPGHLPSLVRVFAVHLLGR